MRKRWRRRSAAAYSRNSAQAGSVNAIDAGTIGYDRQSSGGSAIVPQTRRRGTARHRRES